jgi:phosphoenolpyruvate phosphomutase
MSNERQNLRQLFATPGVIRVAGAHDALGAKLAERAGFEAVWSSSLEISASHAVPDADILTMSEFLEPAQAMADAVSIPVVADVDTGYGNANNVIRMVRKFEAAGLAAVCIEDKLFPKINSFISGRQELAPIAEFVGKLMAAKHAQGAPEFMVIARIEALIAGFGLDEALRRAHKYVEAGADAILIHDKSPSPKTIAQFARAWDCSAPLVAIPTTYYTVTIKELEQMGFKMVIYANHGLRSAIAAMQQTFAQILAAGSTAPVEDRIAPMSLVFDLQGFPQLKRDEESFLSGDRRLRAVIPAAGDHMNEYSMKDLSADLPIAMLDINGKPLLQHQVETLNASGIRNITVVGGYKREKIQLNAIRVASNDDWQTTGDMQSVLCGAGDEDADTLVAYSDILFDKEVIARLLAGDADVTLLVDGSYQFSKQVRRSYPVLVELSNPRPASPRTLSPGAHSKLLRIGQTLAPGDAHCEFTGLAYFSKAGFSLLRQIYQDAARTNPDGPFHESASVRAASILDVLQEMVDRGHEVRCLETSSGWLEIHSFADYKLAHELVK